VQERLKSLKKECGSDKLGEVLVEQAIGGMRGIPVSGAEARSVLKTSSRINILTTRAWLPDYLIAEHAVGDLAVGR